MLHMILVALALVTTSVAARADASKDCALKGGDQAIAACTEAIKINPNNFDAYMKRGRQYGIRREFAKSLADLAKALELRKDANAYFTRALIYTMMEENDKAIDDYTQSINAAVTANAGNADLSTRYAGRCSAYFAKKDRAKALQDCDKAIQLDPTNVEPQQHKAMILQHLKP